MEEGKLRGEDEPRKSKSDTFFWPYVVALASLNPAQKTAELGGMDVDVACLRIRESSFQKPVRFLSVRHVRKGVDHLMVGVVGADQEQRAEENLRWLIFRVKLFALTAWTKTGLGVQ
jgi:hypothetical protein